MKPAPDDAKRENADMVRLLKEACGGNPNMTPEAAGVMLQIFIAELAKLAAREEGAGGVKQEWGTSGDIAKIYGLHPKTTPALLNRWATTGKVRVCSVPDGTTGKRGYNRYNLADVQKMMTPAYTAAEMPQCNSPSRRR